MGAGTLAAVSCERAKGARGGLFRFIGKPTAATLEGSLQAPVASEIDEVSHLLARLTFGAAPGDYARVSAIGAQNFIEEQLAPAAISDYQCDRVIRHEFSSLENPVSRLFPRKGDNRDPLQQLFPALRDHGAGVSDLYEYKEKVLLNELTGATVMRAVLSKRQLFEVMVNFWSDHFNIDPSKGECKWLKAADDRDVIRSHALGNFRDLVRASAVSPAMLWYLDGRVNRSKGADEKPNENYARELMELHTLGVHGGYSQADVMEVARCLTGWTVRDKKQFFKGRVEFHQDLHDDGAKQVLGQEIAAGGGARDLDRLLDIVALHPSTAHYIAWKLCRRFIADEPPAAAVEVTAKAFGDSKGDIRTTLRALFASEEFRGPAFRAQKFKRPLHFVVSALRASNAETNVSPQLVEYLLRLGHAPFRYPTPDGYPEESTHWQSTLLWRWNFAAALADNQIKGTTIEFEALRAKVGGDEALMATFLGRTATETEQSAYRESGSGLALLVASPAFQRC
ncbi:MAG: hypothetical protein JWL90_1128 [Chthoniobacteraceae bacterium]|nr:hypothetical protein [Chthoniobacteraceae bacterium]